MIIFAQASFDSIPADWLKFALILIAAIVLFLCAVLGTVFAALHYFNSKRPQRREITPQPLEVRKTGKRFNYEVAEERHEQVERRLDGHDEEIDSLWNAMASEDKALQKEIVDSRARNQERFEEISNSLTEIKTHLGVSAKAPQS